MPKEKILIADDEPDILTLCLRVMRGEGYEAKGVSNGLQAIEAAANEHFDLFLTDIMMPGLKGLDAAQAIREFQPNIICVVMTGYGTMDTAIQALQLGFTEFLVKPFKPQDLKLAVNRALEKERLRSENERLNALVPLFELNKTLVVTVRPDDLANKVLNTAATELSADLGMLMLRDKDKNLEARAHFGFNNHMMGEDLSQLVAGEAQRLLETREQVFVGAPDDAETHIAALMRDLNVQSFVFSPLLAMDTPIGALVLAQKEQGSQFGSADRELLSVLCGQAAIAIQNASLFEEIQRAYRELQELDHMKSEFINIAAHELRTPLAILMGHADLLEEDIREPKTKGRLQIIIRNALRLRDLINDLLDMRQLQTDEARVNFSKFHLEDLVSAALQDFRPMAERKEIQISANIPPDLPAICSDRQRILIILNNLIKNAIEFTTEGGQVGVDVMDRGTEMWVSVWDTGIGIAEENFDRIFRPFYQVEASLTREHEGMGLGLSIAKGMVELCGGRIWVESELDAGSRFTFSLPR